MNLRFTTAMFCLLMFQDLCIPCSTVVAPLFSLHHLSSPVGDASRGPLGGRVGRHPTLPPRRAPPPQAAEDDRLIPFIPVIPL